jgi:hypothetical protein
MTLASHRFNERRGAHLLHLALWYRTLRGPVAPSEDLP